MKLFDLISTLYNNFLTTIKSYLAKELGESNSNCSNNTIFGLMINVINAIAQNIMLYIEDALVELNKYTAQRKKSIYGLAALSGYEPSLGKASGVLMRLRFKATNENNFNIIIKNKTKFVCTLNGLTYNLILPLEAIVLSIDKDIHDKILYAVEGNYETLSFVATGGKYYTTTVKTSGNIDIDYLTLKINNKEWERVDSIYDMKPNAEQYVIKTSYSNGFDLIFGNNKYGKSLKGGDTIEVTYLTHNGELGNIDSNEKTYFIFQNKILNIIGEDIDGNAIFNVTLANDEAITAGTDSETTAHVKLMIGYNSRSLVLASPENYKRFISGFSFCGYNKTWTEPDSLSIKSLIIKNYKQLISLGKNYFNLKESDFLLTEQLKSSIINSIKYTGNQLAGVTYSICNPLIKKYALYLYVKLKDQSADKNIIKELIRNIVGDFFCNIENNDIYIPKSDIIYEIKLKINIIDGITAYFLSEQNETALLTKLYENYTYTYNASLNRYERKSLTIYLHDNENPNLGLDAHGNIFLSSDEEYPVLMGGWDFMNISSLGEKQEFTINDPLIIIFE